MISRLKKIEHLGIAVKNMSQANDLYARLLGVIPYKEELVESEKVLTSFFKVGESKIELLQGLDEDSPITKFIEKRGEGIHHVAFEVEDIQLEMARLKAEGFTLLNEQPKKGADHKLICFIHPKSTQGVLVELCQEIKEENDSL
ncbi:MAG: methylmalonyl-CoA epimerase [Saprospiraceae bacterium]|nr:methylmalonyl-CoA epimerase [Candidatus Vicinibacter affinis]MBP6172861.1 methylmalonyl-CoA epimerase [Saprospiraceae bacterium]MBP6522399.1 methylmalonyl-CoA epimerase [Saprospiraceae bacterium]HQX44024.1 methylmalonyl-CoA epimerase [Saprospiraceae bacterium]